MKAAKTSPSLSRLFLCAVLSTWVASCVGRDGFVAFTLADGLGGEGADPNPGDQGDPAPGDTTDDCGTACSSNVTIAALTASDHTIALRSDGAIKAWGSNIEGQLGLGDTVNRGDQPGQMGSSLPTVNLGTGRTVLAAVAAGPNSCAMLDDHTVKCWGYGGGDNALGGQSTNIGVTPSQMGDGLPIVALGTGRTATAIAGIANDVCVILDNQTMKCWGYNANGNLGIGDTNPRGPNPGDMGDNLPAIQLGTGRTPVSVHVGYQHTCAILDDGSLKCWGSNAYGQLGDGVVADVGGQSGQMGDALPTVDLGGGTIQAMAVGGQHNCVLLAGNVVKCWGRNDFACLGLGDTNNRGDNPGEMGTSLPAVDLGGGTVKALIAGELYSCALIEPGIVKCWGHGLQGQLGSGSTADVGGLPGQMGTALPAVALGTGRLAVAIVAGQYHACALLDDGTLKCWGYNGAGQLGQGDTTTRGDAAGQMGDNLPTVPL